MSGYFDTSSLPRVVTRQRSQTLSSIEHIAPRAPSTKPNRPPGSPPTLYLPPRDDHLEPVTRKSRSRSMNVGNRPAPSTSSVPGDHLDVGSMSVLHASTADHVSFVTEGDFYLSEEEVSPSHRSIPRPPPLPISMLGDTVDQVNDEFPASPILRTCLQQLSERHRSDSLNG